MNLKKVTILSIIGITTMTPLLSWSVVEADSDLNARESVNYLSEKKQRNIYDELIKTTRFDQSSNKIVLELTHSISSSEMIVIREGSVGGNGIAYTEIGSNQISIDYNKIKYGTKYYIQYVSPEYNATEEILNHQFLDFVQEKVFINLEAFTSDDKILKGDTAPNAKVELNVLSDDEYIYETKADKFGKFSIDIGKILPGREVLVKATGKYNSLLVSKFVQVGKETVENWFYNPNFENEAKGWFTYGADATITPKDGYTNFKSETSNGKIGATQEVEARYGSMYRMSMDIKVNKFKDGENGEYKEIYLGEVIPGGGINPSFSEVTELKEGTEGTWQRVTFESPYFNNNSTTTLGFTIWGVDDADIKNITYTRIDR